MGGQATGVPRRMSGVCPEEREWRVRHAATLRVDDEPSLGSKETVADVDADHTATVFHHTSAPFTRSGHLLLAARRLLCRFLCCLLRGFRLAGFLCGFPGHLRGLLCRLLRRRLGPLYDFCGLG